jgi:hypothetical protein
MFVIKDLQGNYLSPASFQANTKDKWLYITFTGRTTGFFSYNIREQAYLVKRKLDETSIRIGTDRGLRVVEINIDKIDKGERIIEEI